MKTCNTCGEQLPESSFYSNRAKCISCYRFAGTLYRSQLQSAAVRGQSVTYSQSDLLNWLTSHPGFQQLWDDWVASGYQSDLKPSVDRLHEAVGYTFSNIQLITWNQNRGKTRQQNKYKAVASYHLDGTLAARYESLRQASDAIGRCKSDISKAANGQRKTCAKLTWKWI